MAGPSGTNEQSPNTQPTALIIPALNEEPVIGWMLDNLPRSLFTTVVVADNGSTDRTAGVAAAHGATVVAEPRRGYGAACLRALASLPHDVAVAVFMQADGSEEGAEAHALIGPILDGRADLVIGSRVLGRADAGALLLHQRFGNWLATTLIRFLFGYRYTDLGPFRAISRAALQRLQMRELDFGWTVEMQVRALQEGLSVIEIPVQYHKRVAGTNKVSGNLRASITAGVVILSTVFRLWRRYGGSASR
jgi:glycosyltransferase involved in cell wall biosynthesis